MPPSCSASGTLTRSFVRFTSGRGLRPANGERESERARRQQSQIREAACAEGAGFRNSGTGDWSRERFGGGRVTHLSFYPPPVTFGTWRRFQRPSAPIQGPPV